MKKMRVEYTENEDDFSKFVPLFFFLRALYQNDGMNFVDFIYDV